VALLADIREVFAENCDRMSSADLVAALTAMADKPWGECNRGKALTQNGLARRLKEFGISHEKVGPKTNRVNGYSRAAFDDAFSRYLPGTPFQSGHLDTTNEINDLHENATGHHDKGCPDGNHANLLNSKKVSRCPDENPGNGACDENGALGTVSRGSIEAITRVESEPVPHKWEDRF
jgi:Protein of unknown function (DUF3631)